MEQSLPIRCRAEEATAQLRLLLAGMPFLAERSWQEVGWGRMRIELLSLWRIELLLEPDLMAMAAPDCTGDVALSLVERAAAPDGRCWVYGCQRDDWTLGPESHVVEPLQFLSAEERSALEVLLRGARCWPEPISAEAQAPVVVQEERIRPKQRRQRLARRSLTEIP
jgi:hypothetical protein